MLLTFFTLYLSFFWIVIFLQWKNKLLMMGNWYQSASLYWKEAVAQNLII